MSDHPDLDRAVIVLRRGGLVAFPTETVYGLGADATNDEALARLYAVKRRPAEHPVIVHVGAGVEWERFGVDVSGAARRLTAEFWPGPLTVVVAAAGSVSRVATGGLDTVGLRMPDHPVALELLAAFGGALAAPSANRFGRVSPTTADAVARDLGADVDVVLDGGVCAVGVESTIVDCSGPAVRVLRLGGVTLEALAEVLGEAPEVGGTTRAPGTLPSHYAPDAHVELTESDGLAARAAAVIASGRTVGVIALAPDLLASVLPPGTVTLATIATATDYAHELYRALREADELGVDVVVAVPPDAAGLGAAVRDRLNRAAAGR